MSIGSFSYPIVLRKYLTHRLIRKIYPNSRYLTSSVNDTRDADYVDVKTINGVLRGKTFRDEFGKHKYYSFTGVPYAEPPVGELRFKEPYPTGKWDGVKSATDNDDKIFAQNDLISKTPQGVEELVLNVYTPGLPKNVSPPLPVMVYIHQGGFQWGAGCKDVHGPDILVENDVVHVSINYRLGLFGFLCLDIPQCVGNMGLKDQVMALEWVKNNIACFNGDPSNVTIFGSSAGAASVNYHLLSPMSKGLFHKAILHSGCAINHWAFRSNPFRFAYELAGNLGITFNDHEQLLTELKKHSTEELLTASSKLEHSGITFFHPFLPVAEKKFKSVNNFLTADPLHLMTEGSFANVPTMLGFCKEEALVCRLFYPQPYEEIEKNKNPEEITDIGLNEKEKSHLRASILDVYGDNMKQLSTEFIGDLDFTSGIFLAAQYLSKENPNVYAFQFSYSGILNYVNRYCNLNPALSSATHLDDLGYLTTAKFLPKDNLPESDVSVKNIMSRMWTNFAKYGNPTPETDNTIKTKWQALKNNEYNCLDINNETKMLKNAFEKRRNLWKTLYPLVYKSCQK